MWNSYFSYLDYLQIRRRIERRLSRSVWLFVHIAVFAIVPSIIYYTYPVYPAWWNAPRPFLVQPAIGAAMFGWSIVLLLHGLRTYFRSGAWASRRSQAIETEMRERVQNNDSYLVQDARDLFRLHGLLEDDVRWRASATITPLAFFTVVNGLLWIVERGGTYTATAWYIAPLLALFLLPILAINLWGARRHERKLRDIIASDEPLPASKPKRESLRFAGDDEILDIIEEDGFEKPKRSIQ